MLRSLPGLVFLAVFSAACGQATELPGLPEFPEYVPSDSLFVQIVEARGVGDYDCALRLSRARLDGLRDASSRDWERQDEQRRIQTLQRIISLAPAARREMATADSLLLVIWRLRNGEKCEPGVAQAERVLDIRRRHFGAEHIETVAGDFEFAAGLLQVYDLDRAEEHLWEVLDRRRRILGEHHPDVAWTLQHLSAVHLRRGEAGEAEPLLREALFIARQCHDPLHPDIAKFLYGLGWILVSQSDYAAAEPLLRRALSILDRCLPGDDPRCANCLDGVGAVLALRGDPVAAEPYFRRALEMRRRILPGDHPEISWGLSNLASVMHDKQDYPGAMAALQQALEIQNRLYGEEHDRSDTAQFLNNLGYVCREAGHLEDAAAYFSRARAMIDASVGRGNLFYASFSYQLANARRDLGQFAGADSLYTVALATYRSVLGEEHPDVGICLVDHASCLQYMGDQEAAGPLFEKAVVCFETARVQAGSGLARATFRDSPYSRLAASMLLLGREQEAWPAAERALGRALADLLFVSGRRSLSEVEIAREDSLKQELSRMENQLAGLQRVIAADSTSGVAGQIESARSRLLDTEAAWSDFERLMAGRYNVTEGGVFSLERVQAVLDSTTAIVGWLSVETGLDCISNWAWVVRRSGPVHWISLPGGSGSQDLLSPTATAGDFHEALAMAGSWPFRVTDTTRISKASKVLWEQWLQPLLPYMDSVTHLVVVSAGPLLGVPLEALIDLDGRFLGDRYAVSYAPSATIHTWLCEQATSRSDSTPPRALLIGDPPFTFEHLMAMTGETAVARGESAGCISYDEFNLPRLPRTRDEVEKVATLLPGAMVLLGADASEQAICRLADADSLRQFRFIHLATHATVDDRQPQRSALVLSRVGLPDAVAATIAGERVYDGLLTMKEIVRQWNLDADLVTLSACQTGLGREAGGEGYIGLVHAFLQAGARSLLVSLWLVDDEATALLMGRFYENLIGVSGGRQAMPGAEALREAKCWLRDRVDPSGTCPFRHPAYWSAFILVGRPH